MPTPLNDPAERRRRRHPARPVLAVFGTTTMLAGLSVATLSASAEDSTDDPAAPPAQSDQPIGYASMNGGTTGGFGADDVQEYTLSEYWPTSGFDSPGEAMYQLLYEHKGAPESEGLVIRVDETITPDQLSHEDMRLEKVQNVSILGVGDSGEFDGVGINLIEADNIVIRNLTIHHVAQGTGDGVTVQRDSTNVWVDHNEIYSEFQGVDKDVYDALIDVRKGSEYVTVSWNHLHDAWHNGLTGSSDSEGEAGDLITYANNWIENTNSRNPMIRYSDVHMLNNYFLDVADTGINVRMGAQVLVEGNYFENVGSGEVDEETGDIRGPVGWFYGSPEPGYWNLVDNAYAGTTPYEHLESTGDFTVPYEYTALSPDEAKQQAMAYTGPNGGSGTPGEETTPPDDETTPPPSADALYVAPDGSTDGSGAEDDPTTLISAIDRIDAGGTIYMRGGTYAFSETVHIEPGNDGTSSDRTELFAYPGETPVLNFSAQSEDSANRGLAIGGDWWHLHGLIVEHAGDNGILLGGNDNIIERVVTRFNRDTGLQLSRYTAGAPSSEWPSNNLVISSVSHDNADSDGEDADGFAPKLTVGPGNVFRYTVSHNNIDDGYDLFTKDETGPIGVVTIEHSLAYDNGTLSDGSQAGDGDRNGFKLGGEGIGVDHVIRGNIAYQNGKHGFTYNRNLGTMEVSGNVSIDNEERNFNFDGGTSVFSDNASCYFDSGRETNDRIIGDDDGSNQFWSDESGNGTRCSDYSGELSWSFNDDGSLDITFD